MYTTFKFAAMLSFLPCIIAQAMGGGIEDAKIKDGIIEGATHYLLINGGITQVWRNTPEPVAVCNKPKAFFYGYNPKTKENEFLGEVEVADFDRSTLERLDKLVDLRAALPIIKKATIVYCIKRGRMITFFDKDGNSIDTVCQYGGPTDILSGVDNLPFRPHALLKDLEEVEESKLRAFPLWLLGVPNTRVCVKYDSAKKVRA